MDSIQNLAYLYFKYRFKQDTLESLVEWGMNRMNENKEENNMDIILLAGVNFPANVQTKHEIEDLVEKILQSNLDTQLPNDEFFMGKYIEELWRQYQKKQLSIAELDKILTVLFPGLDYPDWLVMLSRNCEYATDIQNFVKPFEDEFNYVAGLWSQSSTLNDFLCQYNRKISDTHDIF
jgi:hypothetical protein